MDAIVGWTPLVWIIRFVLVLVVCAGAWIVGLYLIRFFRWKNIKAIAGGELPDVKVLHLLGQHVELQDEETDEMKLQIQVLNQRLSDVEDRHQALDVVFGDAMRRLLPRGGGPEK